MSGVMGLTRLTEGKTGGHETGHREMLLWGDDDNDKQERYFDRATQPMDAGRLR